MTNLRATVESDLDTIRRWVLCDPWHAAEKRHSAEWMLTPGGLLAYTLQDEDGPICFVRLDADVDLVRFATQFGPEDEVSKRRLVEAMLSPAGLNVLHKVAKANNFKGLVFESKSELLINFMKRQGFQHYKNDDYALFFEV